LQFRTSGVVFATLCLIWGSTWLAIKIGLEFLPPFLFAGIRFAVASLALLVLVRLLHARVPKDLSSWILMLFLGIFQISLPYGLVFWGEQYISSGISSLLFATLPFFVVIFAHFMIPSERLTKSKAIGIVASFVGLTAIFWRDIIASQSSGVHNSLYGGLAVVGSALSGGSASVVVKLHAHRIDPAANVLVQAITGTVVLSSVGLLIERNSTLQFTPIAIAATLYLGIVGSALAFVGLYWLLTRTAATATNTSLIVFVTPIIALIMGWVVLGEVLDANVALGAILILAGVYLTVKPASRST